MARKKSNVYEKLLEFDSVKQYLSQSIGAKKNKINTNSSFEDLIQSVDVSQYLRGLVIFFEYFEPASNPYELIQYIENMGNDKKKISEFVKTVDNFVSWLKAKGYADKSVVKYQAHVRGFVHKNHYGFSFKNWDAESERKVNNENLGIDIGVVKELLWKIPDYTNDYYLKMLSEGMQKTGLGSGEIRSLTFGDLRYRFRNNGNGDETKFVKIEKKRSKNTQRFVTWFYGDYKRKVIKHLANHPKSEYPDDQSWLLKSYKLFNKLFSNAYKRIVEKEFPELLNYDTKTRINKKTGEAEEYTVLKKIATLHAYRKVFCGSAEVVGVPSSLIDLFVGHKGDSIRNIYHEVPDKQKLEFFKKVQEELFGVRESDTRSQIEKEIIDRFMENLLNKGKRETIFHAVNEHPEHLKDETTDRKMGYFIQKLITIAKDELKQDSEFREEMYEEFEERISKRFNLTAN